MTNKIMPSFKHGFARGSLSKRPNLWKGLIGYWKPSLGVSGINTLYDVSGYNNHGTLNGSMTSADWVIDNHGYALDFDGVDDYVDTNFTKTWGTNESFTYSLWIKTTNTGNDNEFLGVIYALGANDPGVILIQTTAGGGSVNNLTIFVRDDNGNNTGWQTGSITINDDEWHLIVLVREANVGIRTYIDGVEDLNVADAIATTTTLLSALYLGARNNRETAGFFWNGLIDDVRIYNRALPANEIKDMYVNPNTMFEFRDRAFGRIPSVGGLFGEPKRNYIRNLITR